MQIFTSYHAAFQSCMQTKTWAVAHLNKLSSNMNIDTSGCYKVFFLLSGNKLFHIDNHTYETDQGDLFFIVPREWHYFSHFDEDEKHERFVLFIFPDYLSNVPASDINLTDCFTRAEESYPHRLKLSSKDQDAFLYYMHKLATTEKYGQNLLEYALFLQLMVFVNSLHNTKHFAEDTSDPLQNVSSKVNTEILPFINAHIAEDLSIQSLAGQFFLSPSYLCKIFRNTTGTTIHKYVMAQRITLAKDLLSAGNSVMEVCLSCGFRDYNVFLKAFTKHVGISPKKYSQLSIEI